MGLDRLKSAYRGSGKVAYACLHHFSCDGIEFIAGKYVPHLNFENMSQEFSTVANFDGDKSRTSKLFDPGLATTTLVPQFLARITYAGAIAAKKFRLGNGLPVEQRIALTDEDKTLLENVDSFIGTYHKNISPDQFRDVNLHLVWMDIENEKKLWNSIVALANELDVSPGKKLSSKRINSILNKQHFWNFRNMYWEFHDVD